jgi:hypothetical protein
LAIHLTLVPFGVGVGVGIGIDTDSDTDTDTDTEAAPPTICLPKPISWL